MSLTSFGPTLVHVVDYCFFLMFLCLSSGCICVFVCVLNCLSCCHYGVIKHLKKHNHCVRNGAHAANPPGSGAQIVPCQLKGGRRSVLTAAAAALAQSATKWVNFTPLRHVHVRQSDTTPHHSPCTHWLTDWLMSRLPTSRLVSGWAGWRPACRCPPFILTIN